MRPHALLFAPLLFTSSFAVACSSSSGGSATTTDAGDDGALDDTADQEDFGPPAPSDWDRSVTPPSDTDAPTQRASCMFKAGALPAETHGSSAPMGSKIPIDHIIVIVQENRSFDHYFQKLKAHGHADAEVAPDTFTNPGVDGKPVAPYRDTQLCFVDTSHGWNSVHTEVNGGMMDGFVKANDHMDPVPVHGTDVLVSGNRAMTYYEPADLPFMYWAADNYAIADHYHCSVQGPTWPNRMYVYAANSFGKIENSPPEVGSAFTIFDELQMRRVPWKVYYTDSPPEAMFVKSFLAYQEFHYTAIDQFYVDAAAGNLPAVSFLDASDGNQSLAFTKEQDDEHPPSNMQVGQAFLARVTKAAMASPNWKSTAIFITYDEHGGLWDHVPPPPACAPDGIAPHLGSGDVAGDFTHLSVRVPFVVISPYAKKGFIGHHTYDHSSIPRFIEARFTMPAMSGRDANAEAPFDLFDFSSARTDSPAVPDVPIDQAALDRCASTFNK